MVPHIAWSALLRSFGRIIATVVLGFVVLTGIGGAVVAQAGRDEATTADTAVLMLGGADGGEATRLDRVVRLYLSGQISRVVLAGEDPTPARDALVARGIVQEKIAEARDATELGQIRAVQQVLRETRVTDAMLIGEPVEALRLLKIARDHGLPLRSAPTGVDSGIDLARVADEVGRYLVYSFIGR